MFCSEKFPLCLCVLSSSSLSVVVFSVPSFIWRALIHLDLNFVEVEKKGLICISLMTRDVKHFLGAYWPFDTSQLRILCLALYPIFSMG